MNVLNFGDAQRQVPVDPGHAIAVRESRRSEAASRASELMIAEVAALRRVDDVAPAEAATDRERLVGEYRGDTSRRDELRLPSLRASDALAVRRALSRIATTDSSRTKGIPSSLIEKERRMLELLKQFDAATAEIHRSAGGAGF